MDELRYSEQKFRQEAREWSNEACVLQLYIAGSSPRSRRAVANVQRICQMGALQGACELQVIDVFQQPQLAKSEQIVALPTLVKKSPIPKRLFIGDMSNTDAILAGLNA